MENAEVELEECSCSDVTDSSGKVIFYNIDSGSYSVFIEKDGYKTSETTVNINRDGILFTVRLEKSSAIPGFEFLTLLVGLIVAIYLRKKDTV